MEYKNSTILKNKIILLFLTNKKNEITIRQMLVTNVSGMTMRLNSSKHLISFNSNKIPCINHQKNEMILMLLNIHFIIITF